MIKYLNHQEYQRELDYPGGPNVTTKILLSEKGREKSQSERFENAMLIALKKEEWILSQ